MSVIEIRILGISHDIGFVALPQVLIFRKKSSWAKLVFPVQATLHLSEWCKFWVCGSHKFVCVLKRWGNYHQIASFDSQNGM